MPNLGGWEFVILVGILVLLFGAKKLPDMARSIGQSARVFKGEMKGMKSDDAAAKPAEQPPAAPPAPAQLPPATPVAPVAAAPVTPPAQNAVPNAAQNGATPAPTAGQNTGSAGQ
jgi:sec-independent protein translocase protein TatA